MEEYETFQDYARLCWLELADCIFQRHNGDLTFCESLEIYDLCINNEDINFGEGFTLNKRKIMK